MANNQIRFGVGFDVDKSSINELKKSLESIQKMSIKDIMKINNTDFDTARNQLTEIRKVSSDVQDALQKAFNQKLNTYNIQTFNNEIKKSSGSLQNVHAKLQSAGTQGTVAFRNLANQLTTTNKELKQTHKLLDSMATSLGNTIKWNIASSAVNTLTGSIQQAYGYVKNLDRSLNDIRIVTGQSADAMDDFAKKANDAAKGLGKTTVDYTDAALTFYQQGLSDEEVEARANLTLKVANASGLDAETSSEYVTSVLNGYKVAAEDAEAAMDILARVGADTASGLDELAEGMSKVASTANSMGVSEEQLAATLATVISTTRQNAATVGTAFKTIYARISDIEAGVEEAEVSLGDYTGAMAEMGFNVLDSTGHLRDLGEVVEEIGYSWKDLTREQQISLAQTMAGTRQYNNLIALFDNWDDYVETLEGANNATGTLQEQQDIYMESTKAHLNQLKVSAEDVYDSLLDTNVINGVSDVLSGVLGGIADWIDSIGGGVGVLKTLGSVGLMVFSQQIGKSINTTIQNFTAAKNNAEQLKNVINAITEFKAFSNLDVETQKLLEMKETFYELSETMSPETFAATQQEFANLTNRLNLVDTLTADKEAMDNFLEQLSEAGTEITTLENLNDNFDVIEENIRATQSVLGKSVKDLRSFGKNLKTALDAREFGQARTIIDQTKSAIDELYNSGNLSEQAFKRAEKAMAEYRSIVDGTGNTVEQEIAAFERVQAIMTGSVSGEARAFDGMADRIRNEFSGASESIVVALERAQQEARDAGITIEQALRNAARQEIISNFTKIAGAVSTLGSAVSTLKNIGDIWSDEALSTGEKIFQTITNIATALSMLIGGYTSLITGVKGASAAYRTYTTALVAQTAATQGATTATNGLTAAIMANPILAGVAAVLILGAAAAWTAYSVSVKNAEAEQKRQNEEAIKSAEINRDRAKTLNDVYESYKSVLNIYKETGENEAELRQATLDLAEAYEVQINALDILSGKYDGLNKDIAEARRNSAKEALDTARDGLSGAESSLILDSSEADSYFKGKRQLTFNTGFIGSRKDSEISDFLDSQLQTLLPEDFSGQINKVGTQDKNFNIVDIEQKDFMAVYEAMNEAYSQLITASNENENLMSALSSSKLDDNIRDWLADSKEMYQKYLDFQKDIETLAPQLAEAEIAYTKSTTGEGTDITEIQSLEDFKKYKEQYLAELERAMGGEANISYDKNLYESTDEYLNYLADQYLKTIDYVSDYVETANIESSLFDRMMIGNSSDEGLKKKVQDFLGTLGEEDFKLIATIGIDEGATKEEVEKALELAKIRAEETMSQQTASAINTVLDSYNAEKDLTKDQQEELTAARKLVDAYMEEQEGIRGMTTAAEEWAQVSQQGTLAQVEYLQDLTQRQNDYANHSAESMKAEAEAELELLKIKKDRLDAQINLRDELASSTDLSDVDAQRLEELNTIIESNTDNVETLNSEIKKLEESINDGDWDLQVDMANVDDLLTVGDSILSEAEKIQKAAELIGEGFTVAAEDADALAEIFPALYENATVTADGIVQLDKNVVQSLLGNQQLILDGDVNTNIAKIDNQIALLEAKKTAAEAELSLWQSVAEGELNLTKDALEAMAGGQESFTNYLIELGADESEATAAVTQAMAGNYEELSSVAEKVAKDMDINIYNGIKDAAKGVQSNASNMITSLIAVMRQAQQVATAIANMDNGTVAGSAVGGAGGGASGGPSFSGVATKGNFNISDTYKATTAGSFVSDAIDRVNLDVSKYTSAIAQLNALKARLRANQTSASKALKGASSGAGGKQDDKKGKSSGKKGKSGKEEKEANQIDKLEDEADTYHDIDIQIQKITKDLDKLQEVQERLTGKDLINNLNKQLKVLQKQRDAYQEKVTLAEMEAKAYKSYLASAGAKFSSNGQVANYYDLLDSALARVNKTIAKYNSLSADKQTDKEKEKVEVAKKEYESIKDILKKYEDTINDLIPDLKEQIEDSLYETIEIQISKFNMTVEIELDLSKAQKSWNEFNQRVLKADRTDQLTTEAERIRDDLSTYYSGKKGKEGSIGENSAHIKDLLKEIELLEKAESSKSNNRNSPHSNIYSTWDKENKKWVHDTAAAYEDLRKYTDQLMEDLIEVEELQEELNDLYLESIDNVAGAFDEVSEYYEFVAAQQEHELALIELLYGDEAYAEMAEYYEVQTENSKNTVAALQNQADYWKQMWNEAEAAGDSEAAKKYQENWMSTIQSLNSEIERWAENLLSEYENTINLMMKKLNDSITGGQGLSYVGEELDLMNMNADNYLDAINSAYALQKLENQWKDSIDATDEVTTQRELNKLMEEQLKMLEEKGRLTQYDIDRAELEYQIALKQIALRESQMNKSTMRLRRDANGNYSYQFVSDQDQIRQAQQELAEAQNNLYNFDKQAYQNNLNEAYAIWDEYQSKVTQVYLDFADDEEERTKRLELLQREYGEKINFLTEQNKVIRENLINSSYQSMFALYAEDFEKINSFETGKSDKIAQETAARKGMTVDEFKQKALAYQADREEYAKLNEDEKEAFREAYQARTGMSDEEFEEYIIDRDNDYRNYTDTLNAETEGLVSELARRTGLTEAQIMELAGMYEESEGDFDKMVKSETALLNDGNGNGLFPTWNSGVQGMIDSVAGGGGLEEVTKSAFGEMDAAAEEYQSELNEIKETNDEVSQQYDEQINKIQEKADAAVEAAQRELVAVKEVLDSVTALADEYKRAADEAKRLAEEAENVWRKEQEQQQKAAKKDTKKATTTTTNTKTTSTSSKSSSSTSSKTQSSNNSSSSSSPKPSNAVEGVAAAIWLREASGWGTGNTRANRLAAKGVSGAQTILNNSAQRNKLYENWNHKDLKPYYYGAFEVGGYTGKWTGSEGRPFLLHPEEMVLNKKDTINLLSVIETINDMVYKNGLMEILNKIPQAVQIPTIDFSSLVSSFEDKIEQTVNIEANFPGVEKATEIQNAFNNIVNIATQRAYRNRR